MAEIQVWQDIGVRNERFGKQETQGGGLDRAAQIKRAAFEVVRQIGHDHLAHAVTRGPIQDQSKRAFGIMLADEDNRALEEGASQLSTIEKQLPLQKIFCFRHILKQIWMKIAPCQNFVFGMPN